MIDNSTNPMNDKNPHECDEDFDEQAWEDYQEEIFNDKREQCQ